MHDSEPTTPIRLERRSAAYWRVTFDIPPLNIFGPQNMAPLTAIVAALETDKDVKVVVFDSAIEGFFLTHYDFLAMPEDTLSLPLGPTGLQQLPDALVRLSRAPVVSIAKIRGRALEVLLGADDIRGDIAELYGYVNRALPDAELDGFVDALAERISSFDKQAIAETKRLANKASLPPDSEVEPEWDAFIASLARPATQARIKMLMGRGFHKPGDVETRLGYHVGQLGR